MEIVGPPLPPAPAASLLGLVEALDHPRPALRVARGRQLQEWTGRELLDLARRWQRAVQEQGLRPGERAIVWMPNDERFVAAFLGVLLAGGTAVPLAGPGTSADPLADLARLRPLVEAARARLLLGPAEVEVDAPWAPPRLGSPASQPAAAPCPIDPDAPAFLQFTSGSLGRPRAAVIPHRAALACVRSMALGMGLHPGDQGISWLPLHHDMGLVGGLLCPLLVGFPLELHRPGDFLLHPGRFLARAAEIGATICAGPDFSWRLLARRGPPRGPAIDLSRLRVALNGAEPVHRSTLDGVRQVFGPLGLSARALRPCYGLAENTLAVTIYDPDLPAGDLHEEGRRLVSVGRPLPGVTVRLDAQGQILVRSASTMRGYVGDEEGVEEQGSAAALADGWLHTGDLGRIAHGQLYIRGRIKDLVIHHGQKFHPYDIERVAAEAAGSPPNGAAAFARAGAPSEELVVLVEVRGALRAGVEERVQGALLEALGLRPDRVVTVDPGALPRTTSGKIRRPEVARLYGGAPSPGGRHG